MTNPTEIAAAEAARLASALRALSRNLVLKSFAHYAVEVDKATAHIETTTTQLADRDAEIAVMRAELAVKDALEEAAEAEPASEDWWKPDPEDPFWMLEASDGSWLKNVHSRLTTREPAKAKRFPSLWDADRIRQELSGSGWIDFKPTEHTWIAKRGIELGSAK